MTPTSRSIEGHILRYSCIIRQQTTLLAEHKHELKLSDYSWCREPDMTIKSEKKLLFIPNLGRAGGNFTSHCWFTLNNSERVKAVILPFCSI